MEHNRPYYAVENYKLDLLLNYKSLHFRTFFNFFRGKPRLRLLPQNFNHMKEPFLNRERRIFEPGLRGRSRKNRQISVISAKNRRN